ncbi:hypothetical protein GIY30_17445 [Gordonia sp. HNM0687]|uniref:GNAT family N-acetyltransferase n=1 Tax=Gordonia mangrovi TaxID=2665643 RepID=A0A6L7GWY1_9ACTN|nr:GNAT family N-acetyltransferase [Gordonia mangrovi]MXP23125.1 hypothetical protein [Gordonia mangrovi]UVF77408.1 GNAT family N-acetyltransferase [Gordonia mangrovi]
MQPVEINAGTWYLRALRADDRVTDVPALSDLGVDDPTEYIAGANRMWASESGYVWAVCEPTTGELVALIGVRTAPSRLVGRARPGRGDALEAARAPVRRFAEGALGLTMPTELVDDIS